MSSSSWSATDSDISLVAACLEGQEAAWEALISKYERLIYAVCRRYSMQPEDADEIFSRVCLLVLQHLSSLKDYTRLTPWLITTTSRECWHYKKRLALTTSLTPLATDSIWPTNPDSRELIDQSALPEEELLRLETQQQMRESFQQLSPRCQKLLWHLFYDPARPAYQQIAQELNMPVASIGPNRARCLNKLRELFEKTCNE